MVPARELFSADFRLEDVSRRSPRMPVAALPIVPGATISASTCIGLPSLAGTGQASEQELYLLAWSEQQHARSAIAAPHDIVA